jgi:hypothetical protein
MDKTPVILFLLLAMSPLPVVSLMKMRQAMQARARYSRDQNWSQEYSAGMFAIMMGGIFGLTICPYLAYGYYLLFR